MTHIVLTRHGHVEGISPPRFRGRHDLPLTPKGRDQARQLGAFLAATRQATDAIYTSPLARCVETGGCHRGRHECEGNGRLEPPGYRLWRMDRQDS